MLIEFYEMLSNDKGLSISMIYVISNCFVKSVSKILIALSYVSHYQNKLCFIVGTIV